LSGLSAYREQSFNETRRTRFDISYGVLQSSVLEPRWYIMYVDSMWLYISGVSTTSFADDTALVVAAKTLEVLVQKAKRVLQQL
ncbi:hypothetical protein QYM36_001601, partial [Artemia franciscana]